MLKYDDNLRTPFPGPVPFQLSDGTVALVGTDGSRAESGEFRFLSASDANVVVEVVPSAVPKVKIGVYYV